MAEIPFEGRWKGAVLDAALEESDKTQSVCLAIKLRLDSLWYPKTAESDAGWYTPENYIPVETVARVWLIKSDGEVSDKGCEQLKDAFNWNGDWGQLTDGINWPAFDIQVSVKPEEYQGKRRMKCNWVYPADAVPGFIVGNVEASKARELGARYGSATRALCGAGTKAPEGAPPAPKRRQAAPAVDKTPTSKEIQTTLPPAGQDIPF